MRDTLIVVLSMLSVLLMAGCASPEISPSATQVEVGIVTVAPTFTIEPPRAVMVTLTPDRETRKAAAQTNQIKTATIQALTNTKTPTLTPSPSPSITPSSYPTLISNGSYLLYDNNSGNGPLTITNENGINRQEIVLRGNSRISNLQKAISPDGKWLAFYSGSAEPPYNLAINLLSLPFGEIKQITPLLSESFPDNLSVLEDYYHNIGHESLVLNSSIFEEMIRVFEWSPDGTQIAFASQHNSQSSNLFLYNLTNGNLTQLTDTLDILAGITWSPDGKWILIRNDVPGSAYHYARFYRIRPERGKNQDSGILNQGPSWMSEGWIANNLFLFNRNGDGGDANGLHILNLDSAKIVEVWPGTFFDYAVDPINRMMAIGGIRNDELGTFLATFEGQYRKISENYYERIIGFVDYETPYFIAADYNKVIKIGLDGNITDLYEKKGNEFTEFLVSPNKQWFLLYSDIHGSDSIPLFTLSGEFIQEISVSSEYDIDGIIWKSDSTGLILTDSLNLYTVDIPGGEMIRIDQCDLHSECRFESRLLASIPW